MELLFFLDGTNIFFTLIFTILIGSTGLPIGTMLFVMYAGAVAETYKDLLFLILLVYVFFCLGDFCVYMIGDKLGNGFVTKFGEKEYIKKKNKEIRILIKKYGSLSIFLSRWLFPGVGPFLNYYLGFKKFNLRKYVFFAFTGEAVYSLIFPSLGYYFKNTWEDLFTIISNFSIGIFFLAVIGLIIWHLVNNYKKYFRIRAI